MPRSDDDDDNDRPTDRPVYPTNPPRHDEEDHAEDRKGGVPGDGCGDDSDGAAVDSDDEAVELQWQAIAGIIIIFLPLSVVRHFHSRSLFRVLYVQHRGVELSERIVGIAGVAAGGSGAAAVVVS